MNEWMNEKHNAIRRARYGIYGVETFIDRRRKTAWVYWQEQAKDNWKIKLEGKKRKSRICRFFLCDIIDVANDSYQQNVWIGIEEWILLDASLPMNIRGNVRSLH